MRTFFATTLVVFFAHTFATANPLAARQYADPFDGKPCGPGFDNPYILLTGLTLTGPPELGYICCGTVGGPDPRM
ncbi:hypothetical protein VKT23_008106 [Stygiomarasmius scandens]|uniref:Uncharacterized protein n=1 Tax=Marasmiellus scandens TaxID=2682957 RepID=A0ABR1JLK3_9AGAR